MADTQEALRVALEELRNWFEAERKSVSKGNGSQWAMWQCEEQIKLIDAALTAATTQPERAAAPAQDEYMTFMAWDSEFCDRMGKTPTPMDAWFARAALSAHPAAQEPAVVLQMGVSTTVSGATIVIMQQHQDGSRTVIYSGEHPLGDTAGTIPQPAERLPSMASISDERIAKLAQGFWRKKSLAEIEAETVSYSFDVMGFARALLSTQAAGKDAQGQAEISDSQRLDFLDRNKQFRMGWSVNTAPVGSLSVTAIIMGGKPIREAIDAAIEQQQKGGAA